MRWTDVESRQPRLAALGRKRLIEPGVLLVVTIRRDGTPRLSPVEPFLLEGQLLLSMLWGSRKAADLQRDPRVLVHSVVVNRDGGDGEFKVRGTAHAEGDRAFQERFAAAVAAELDWRPEPGRFHLFSVDIDEITFIGYDSRTGDQHTARWPSGGESIRRGTSATSLGPPEPTAELLVTE